MKMMRLAKRFLTQSRKLIRLRRGGDGEMGRRRAAAAPAEVFVGVAKGIPYVLAAVAFKVWPST